MSNGEWILSALLALELAVSGTWAGWNYRLPQPPRPDLPWIDSAAADEIQALREGLHANDAQGWQRLAEAYFAFGFFPEAEACYARVSELAPPSFLAAYDRALCLDRLGRIEDAIRAYGRAIELAPRAAGAKLAQRGRCGCLMLAPPSADASVCWYRIGKDHLRAERADEAEDAFLAAGALPHAHYELAKLHLRSAWTRKALPILQEELKSHPKAIEFNQLMARALVALGREREAAAFRERAYHASEGALVDDYFLRVLCIREQYGLERKYKSLLETEQLGGLAQVAEGFQELRRIQPDARFVSRSIEVEQQLGHGEEVQTLFEAFGARQGPTPALLAAYGEACFLLGQDERARAAWERGARMSGMERLHGGLARYFERHGEAERARAERARALHFRGVEEFQKERLPEALRVLHQALDLDPRLAESWYYLGESRRRLEDRKGAAEAYRRCLELDPEHAYGRARMRLAGLTGPVEATP